MEEVIAIEFKRTDVQFTDVIESKSNIALGLRISHYLKFRSKKAKENRAENGK